jgi:hypothetical protein
LEPPQAVRARARESTAAAGSEPRRRVLVFNGWASLSPPGPSRQRD